MGPTKNANGEWSFPESWPPAAREAWGQVQVSLEAERAALAAVEAERAAEAASPETALLAARAEADRLRAQVAREKIEAEDEREIRAAEAQFGARMRVIYTAAGSLIVTWSHAHEAAWDRVSAHAKTMAQAALEAHPPDEVRAESDSLKAYREGYLEHVIVYPKDKNRRREILREYPDAWSEVFEARRELARGPRAAAGKGGGRG